MKLCFPTGDIFSGERDASQFYYNFGETQSGNSLKEGDSLLEAVDRGPGQEPGPNSGEQTWHDFPLSLFPSSLVTRDGRRECHLFNCR